MLDVLRRGASTWVSKLLLSLLIVSFGVWGIADVFRGFGSNTAYHIGSTEIGVVELDQTYNNELRQVSNRSGRPITKEEALRTGLSQQILSKISTDATFREIAKQMHLAVSDEGIGRDIVADPTFKGADGTFDKRRFADLLRNSNLNEAWYVQTRRAESVRAQIMDAVGGSLAPSEMWLSALDEFRNETRKIEYVVLSAASAGRIPAPPADEIAAFYEKRKAAFRAPETRDVVVLRLDATTLAKPGDVTDDDAKAEYTRLKSRFETPEKRRVLQISFDDVTAAQAAAAEIAAGKSFEAMAEARGISAKDLDLGLLAETQFLDAKVGKAAFALSGVGAVSPVIEGAYRPVVLKLAEISQGTSKPFAEVSKTLKDEIANKRAEADVLELFKQVEDAIAGGAKLADVAKRFGVTPIEISKLTHEGIASTGQKVDLPQSDKLVAGVFESDVGVENDVIDLGGHGFMWYAVTQIVPAHDRPLAEVQDKVLATWTAEKNAEKLAADAKGVEARLAEGKSFHEAVGPTGAEIRTSEEFRRSEAPDGLPPTVVAAAFSGPNGHVATVSGAGDDRVIVHVVDVKEAIYFPGTDAEKAIAARVSTSMRNSLVEAFVRAEQKAMGVSANSAVIGRVTGRVKD